MQKGFAADKPIYQQLAEMIEDQILSGVYPEDSRAPSTTELAAAFRINPATAGKGVNLLVDAGILYKKRGLGMFVAQGAREQIKQGRKEGFYNDYVLSLLREAKKLGISVVEIVEMLERGQE